MRACPVGADATAGAAEALKAAAVVEPLPSYACAVSRAALVEYA